MANPPQGSAPKETTSKSANNTRPSKCSVVKNGAVASRPAPGQESSQSQTTSRLPADARGMSQHRAATIAPSSAPNDESNCRGANNISNQGGTSSASNTVSQNISPSINPTFSPQFGPVFNNSPANTQTVAYPVDGRQAAQNSDARATSNNSVSHHFYIGGHLPPSYSVNNLDAPIRPHISSAPPSTAAELGTDRRLQGLPPPPPHERIEVEEDTRSKNGKRKGWIGTRWNSRRKLFIFTIFFILLAIIGLALGLYFGLHKPPSNPFTYPEDGKWYHILNDASGTKRALSSDEQNLNSITIRTPAANGKQYWQFIEADTNGTETNGKVYWINNQIFGKHKLAANASEPENLHIDTQIYEREPVGVWYFSNQEGRRARLKNELLERDWSLGYDGSGRAQMKQQELSDTLWYLEEIGGKKES